VPHDSGDAGACGAEGVRREPVPPRAAAAGALLEPRRRRSTGEAGAQRCRRRSVTGRGAGAHGADHGWGPLSRLLVRMPPQVLNAWGTPRQRMVLLLRELVFRFGRRLELFVPCPGSGLTSVPPCVGCLACPQCPAGRVVLPHRRPPGIRRHGRLRCGTVVASGLPRWGRFRVAYECSWAEAVPCVRGSRTQGALWSVQRTTTTM
jgi:hypothetical protein